MKEEGIKILDLIKGSKPFTRDFPRCPRTRVIIIRRIPAGKGDFADGIFPLNKIVPILGQILGIGILSRHPYNGNDPRAYSRFSFQAEPWWRAVLTIARRFSCLKTFG